MSEPVIDILGYVPGKWRIDTSRSRFEFSVRHLHFFTVRGHLASFEGEIVTDQDPLRSSVEAKIAVASIDTKSKGRDKVVLGRRLLDARNHPEIAFRSTGLRFASGGFVLDGEVTVLAATHRLSLPLVVEEFRTDGEGRSHARFSVRAELNRRALGIVFRGPIPGGDRGVGAVITVNLLIAAVSAS